MTIPRRLVNKHGFQAQADVGINSPQQTNNQSVNVILRGIPFEPDALTKDNKIDVAMNKANVEHKDLSMSEPKQGPIMNTPLNDSIEPIKERSIDTANENLNEMQALLKNKDNLIEALSLILDIYENNPLIVNKLIVAQEDELSRLLFLLTGADQIELIKMDPETGCSCKVDKFTHISKIMITKGGNTYNFKYSFPNVVQLLENRKISYKIVI